MRWLMRWTRPLREQHGGLTPYEFMRKFYHHELGDLSSHEPKMAAGKVCKRWVKEDQKPHEFEALILYNGRNSKGSVLSEKMISKMVAYMRGCLRGQRNGTQLD